jgi:uracil-DNA glycosylase
MMSEERWFGEPSTVGTTPERHGGGASASEIARIFSGHEALDRCSGGRYREFLRAAARCTRCASDTAIPAARQPIPLLCGTIGEPKNYREAHLAIEPYRRAGASLRINPESGVRPLAEFLDAHALSGLSIGHCGWADLTARLRGEQLGDGVDILVLGADWYPITACSNFLLDRYHEDDHTLANFVRQLRREAPGLPSDLGELFRQCRIYLGNTLLCYRTGWNKKGETNLSRRSFDHCRDHLARHVDALAPRVIVTFGREPARSVAHLLEGSTADARDLLGRLRREPRLKKHMEAFYGGQTSPRGIPCLRDRMEVTYVPLCHPSMPNRYTGDYRALAWLTEEPIEERQDEA